MCVTRARVPVVNVRVEKHGRLGVHEMRSIFKINITSSNTIIYTTIRRNAFKNDSFSSHGKRVGLNAQRGVFVRY